MNTRTLFISHGGGPMPLLDDPGHAEMVATLKTLAKELPKPSAILVVSAHWEGPVATVTSGVKPELIYDYYGFPPESYQITYPCVGEPALADKVASVLQRHQLPVKADNRRGFDHGVFVPLKIMYPDADIPCVQLSLLQSLDADMHMAMGEALRGLDYDNLLVLGSGFTFHNMRAFFHTNADMRAKAQSFAEWLRETLTDREMDEAMRRNRLAAWEQAPFARFCHPREEHLLPLHVCYGLAGRASTEVKIAKVLNQPADMYVW